MIFQTPAPPRNDEQDTVFDCETGREKIEPGVWMDCEELCKGMIALQDGYRLSSLRARSPA